MIAINFKGSNRNLKKPGSLTDKECVSMDIYTNGKQCLSKWKMSFRERLKFLFMGYVWVWVWSGQTQPPVLITLDDPFPKTIGANLMVEVNE